MSSLVWYKHESRTPTVKMTNFVTNDVEITLLNCPSFTENQNEQITFAFFPPPPLIIAAMGDADAMSNQMSCLLSVYQNSKFSKY